MLCYRHGSVSLDSQFPYVWKCVHAQTHWVLDPSAQSRGPCGSSALCFVSGRTCPLKPEQERRPRQGVEGFLRHKSSTSTHNSVF